MSTSQALRVKICHFDVAFSPSQYYICYQDESCCKEGCCVNPGHNYFQTWYFWIAITLFFLIYRCGRWYCKKLESSDRDGRTVAAPARRHDNEQVNDLLDQLIVTYSNRYSVPESIPKTSLDLPPRYSVAVDLPKPSTPRGLDQHLPTYEQALSQ